MTQDHHPTIRLVHALNALDCVFSDTEGFRQLAEQRAVHAESNRKIQGLGLSVWAAEQRDAGASIHEVMGSTNDKLAELKSIPALSSENPASIESLQSVLSDGTKAVGWALDALKMGGGDVLDAALNPGASAQTIHLRTKLDEAQSLFGVMKTTLTMTNVSLDSGVEKMADLASWFQQKSRELGAIVEQHGCDGRPPETQNTDNLRSSTWFSDATGQGVYPALLRNAVRGKRLLGSEKRGARWFYSIKAVCLLYPQYREQIEAARANESTG